MSADLKLVAMICAHCQEPYEVPENQELTWQMQLRLCNACYAVRQMEIEASK